MKRIAVILVLGLAVSGFGCATTGYQHAFQVRSAIDQTRVTTIKAHQDLVAALHAVHTLTAKDTSDLQPPYQSFAVVMRGLEKQVHELGPRGEVIQKRGNAYVVAWQKDLITFQSPDLRTLSAGRRLEVVESFRKLNSELLGAEASLHPVLVGLQDVRLYLSLDLTDSGASSLQTQAAQISTQAVDAGQHLQSLLADLDRVAAELSPVKPVKPAKDVTVIVPAK